MESRCVAQLVPPRRIACGADRILVKRAPVLIAAGNVPREKSMLPAFVLLGVVGISMMETRTSVAVATKYSAAQTLTTSKLLRLALGQSGKYHISSSKSIDYQWNKLTFERLQWGELPSQENCCSNKV